MPKSLGWIGAIALAAAMFYLPACSRDVSRLETPKEPVETAAPKKNVRKEIPKVVLDAVDARFPKAKFHSFEKKKKDGKTFYEISITDESEDQDVEVTVTSEGKITQLANEITVSDLPKAVVAVLEEKYAKAKIKSVEEIIEVDGDKETFDCYDVELETADGRMLEISFSEKGKVISEDEVKKR